MEIIFFALDKKASKELGGMCIVVNCFDTSVGEGFYEFGSKDYKHITWHCWLIGDEILKSGKSYVYIDTDIVVKKNFMNDFQFGGYDCLIQTNGKNCCAGFYAMRPTPRTTGLFSMKFLEEHDYLHYPHDQEFFNKVIYTSGLLRIKLLDRDEYPNGEYYYRNHKLIDDICKIIHFNCIKGYDNKVNKMKELGQWI